MLGHNLGREVDYIVIKGELQKYIPEADYQILSQLGYLMLGREMSEEDVQSTLGSDTIESLLEEIEYASYDRLKEIHSALKTQGIIK